MTACFRTLLPMLIMTVAIGCAPAPEQVVGYPPAGFPLARWDDSDYSRVLRAVVTPDGLVRYDLLTRDVDGIRDALARYCAQIARSAPWNRPDLFPNETDRLACYLNAHNALAMQAVLRQGLPRNVRLAGIFETPMLFGQHEIALDDLVNQYLRTAGDPRVHFALCTMSRSSPPLRSEPYAGARLDEQLADQTARSLSDPRLVRMIDSQTVGLSELLTRFYPQDFKSALTEQSDRPRSLIRALAALAPPDSPIQQATRYRSIPFDWTLNSAE